jgi:PHP family Zn ribbon phosphoesterase
LIPLREIIAAVRRVGVNTRTVNREYSAITDAIGSELAALLWATPSDLETVSEEAVARGIMQARAGQVQIIPGFDGQYGSVSLPGQ